MKTVKIFLMFFIVVGALSLIGSASAATNNGTNNLSQNIVSTSSDSAVTHSVVKVSNVEEDIGIDEVSNKLWIVNSTYTNNEIQNVIEGTNSGDTIRFSSGVYDGISLSVTKFLNLEGVNATLNGVGTSPIFNVSQSGSGTTITGFTINGTTNNVGIILNSAKNITINNNTITNTLKGIQLTNSTNNTISNNTVNKNVNGVTISNNSTKNNIIGNIINSNTNTGLKIDTSSNNIIANNTVNRNTLSAITLFNSSYNNLTNNTIKNNGNYGIFLENSSNNTIGDGNSFHMTYEPFYIINGSSNNLIQNNTIWGCPYMPKWDSKLITILNGSNKNNIINNIIEFSISRLIYIENSSYTNIIGNSIGNPLNSTITTTQIVGTDGIVLNNTSFTTISGNSIIATNGTNYTLTGAGIFIIGNKNAVINANNIDGAIYGIRIGLNNTNTTIRNNNITNSNNSAIYSATKITLPNITGKANSTVNITATLLDGNGNPINDETVYYKINGKNVGSSVTNSTILSYILNLKTGTYNITATYAGSQDYESSNLTGLLTVKTPLIITNVTPKKNTVTNNVPKTVIITFNSKIQNGTTGIQFTTDNGSVVKFKETINGNQLILAPTAHLINGSYILTLNNGSITDINGNPVELYSTTFKLDTTPLKITSIKPKNNQTIKQTKSIVIKFNKNISKGTNWIEFTTNKGLKVKFKETIKNNVLTLTPTTTLKSSKYLIIIHTGSIKDAAGNIIPLSKTSFLVKT
jgi:parallel beta-helix repeat protein